MAKLVSKTYGDALFEVALEKNQLEEFFVFFNGGLCRFDFIQELIKLVFLQKS